MNAHGILARKHVGMFRNSRLAVGVVAVSLILNVSACSGNDQPTPDAPYFAGLDPAVVAEVLANPVAQSRIEGDAQADKERRLQGMVINFIVCRDMYRVYETWLTTGVAPEPSPIPQPHDPRADWNTQFGVLTDAARSGDIDRLRSVIIGEGTCGNWIPLHPGQPDGPTIEDAIRELS